jgi:hypothetical protein
MQLRGNAMAVHIPQHCCMAQEAAALLEAEPLPQLLIYRPEAIDHGTPIISLPLGQGHAHPK